MTSAYCSKNIVSGGSFQILARSFLVRNTDGDVRHMHCTKHLPDIALHVLKHGLPPSLHDPDSVRGDLWRPPMVSNLNTPPVIGL